MLKDIGEGKTRRTIHFRYSLGDLRLFRVSFRALIERQAFDPHAEPWSPPVDGGGFPKDVDVVVQEGRHLSERLPRICPTRSALCYFRDQTTNHYIDLSGTFADYLKGFSSKTRSTLQRKVRKLSSYADNAIECREYYKPESVDEFHAMSRQIAVKTYQEKLFDGAIPASGEFVAKIRKLAQSDLLRGFVLFVKQEPVAYLHLPATDDTLSYGYLGYDPDYAGLSPGTVLFYMALEKLFEEQRFRYFDFTYGSGQTKELFGRAQFLHANIYLFRWNLRNVIAVYAHAGIDWFSSRIGDALSALGLRSAIRKLLRRGIG